MFLSGKCSALFKGMHLKVRDGGLQKRCRFSHVGRQKDGGMGACPLQVLIEILLCDKAQGIRIEQEGFLFPAAAKGRRLCIGEDLLKERLLHGSLSHAGACRDDIRPVHGGAKVVKRFFRSLFLPGRKKALRAPCLDDGPVSLLRKELYHSGAGPSRCLGG